jgi:hypothetical protein
MSLPAQAAIASAATASRLSLMVIGDPPAVFDGRLAPGRRSFKHAD